MPHLSRRQMLVSSAAAVATTAIGSSFAAAAAADGFQFKYMVGSCMYGYLYLGEILPEVAKCGASHLDIWPKRHGNQREQLADMGEELFASLLEKHDVKLGCITQYGLGPFRLQDEMKLAQRFGCQTIVTGGSGPKGLKGAELKKAVGEFLEKMKPHLEVAEETGVTIAIENHGNNLIDSPDSLRYLAELRPSKHIAVALAPYHLPQDPQLVSGLIRELGESIEVFYAWQHGDGCMTKLPKDQELKQMPGRGPLDFGPLVKALADIKYSGWTEIFMHPVPRGIPILETAPEVTAEINKSRTYLAELAKQA
ncbi:sugar phosphate isomerase/epimerase family protein [Fuerstiella marisgermanici]|nr:TIM barrel protein [Fuerstiella marisgermanici]